MKNLVLFAYVLLLTTITFGQGVKISQNPGNPHSSALLELSDSTKGFLVNRLTTAQRNAVVGPAVGLMIYNTTTNCVETYFPQGGWRPLACDCQVFPNATFSMAPAAPVINSPVTMTPVTTNALSYSWTFQGGNPATSTAQSPSVTWTSPGSYSVSLTVTDASNCPATYTTTVVVQTCPPGTPASTFTYSPIQPTVSGPVTFTPTTPGMTYSWTFQNGNPATSTSASPSVTWSNTGNYNVTLTVTNGQGCSTTTTSTISVINCPSSSQTFSPNGVDVYSGSPQTFNVPNCVSTIIIEAWGAQGGGSNGGLGAYIKGTFSVTPGEVLTVIVGKQGGVTTQSPSYCAGGGGGSYVYRNANDALPLIVAAGGGGQAQNAAGGAASGNTTPTTGNGTGSGAGGSGGNGGAGGPAPYNYSSGGGGGGWLTNGGNGILLRYPEGQGGKAPRNNANGGIYTHPSFANAHGGYGGGGGASDNSGAGGGGGGYNGGGGGTNYNAQWGSGGGGGSYNGGTNQTNTGNTRSGNGQVIISW